MELIFWWHHLKNERNCDSLFFLHIGSYSVKQQFNNSAFKYAW